MKNFYKLYQPFSIDLPVRISSYFIVQMPEFQALAGKFQKQPSAARGGDHAIRINISMDESLIEQIDRAAEHMGQSRSAFLAEAARARLKNAA